MPASRRGSCSRPGRHRPHHWTGRAHSRPLAPRCRPRPARRLPPRPGLGQRHPRPTPLHLRRRPLSLHPRHQVVPSPRLRPRPAGLRTRVGRQPSRRRTSPSRGRQRRRPRLNPTSPCPLRRTPHRLPRLPRRRRCRRPSNRSQRRALRPLPRHPSGPPPCLIGRPWPRSHRPINPVRPSARRDHPAPHLRVRLKRCRTWWRN